MKYRTFVLIRNTVGVLAVGGLGFGVLKGCASVASRPEPSVAVTDPGHTTPVRRTPVSKPISSTPRPTRTGSNGTISASNHEPLTEVHREALRLSKEPLSNGEASGASRKWRVKQGQVTIELRADTDKGFNNWNRLKIDLDRDKQWDEAWDLKPGKPVKRRFAPSDDENYTATYDLQGETWIRR